MRTPEEILQNWYPNYKKRIAFDENVIEAIKDAQLESLHDFINWYNEHYPENYIPNSRLGNYLQEKESMSGTEWTEFIGNEDLFGQATLNNCLCKFDDGTVCNYNDNHPMAILTHFQNVVSKSD